MAQGEEADLLRNGNNLDDFKAVLGDDADGFDTTDGLMSDAR